MQAQTARSRQLCEQIAIEQDPEKFAQLVNELMRLLEEIERQRLGPVT